MIETKAGAKRADELAALVPEGAWQRISCADGSKGPRLYDWALIGTDREDRHLMVRRSLQPGEKGGLELAYYRCYSPEPAALAEFAAVAGARWGIEDCFAEAKNEAGLDHYQVRRYRAWYRHVTLSMLAHAFLAVTAHAARPPSPAPASGNTGNKPAEKGTWRLWTTFHATQDIRPSGVHNRRNRTGPDPAHRRRGPPPVQPAHERHLASRVPPALVRLEAPPAGRSP